MKEVLKALLLIAAFAVLISGYAFAQQSAAQTAADTLLADSKWEEAAKAYAAITAKEPDNGPAWQNLGEALLQAKKYDAALQAFDHASTIKYRPLVNQVNRARTFAAKGDRAQAINVMREVVASGNGGRVRPVILSSTEFESLMNGAEFAGLLSQMKPCTAPEYRQFDFWVGDWDVQNPAGASVGHNLVTLEQEGCLIIEHWTSATGGQTGTSFNYYDVRDKKWHQLYLDNSGNAGAFPAMAGTLQSDHMVMLTDNDGGQVSRWAWYVLSPGKVRQMAEQSTDGGKTWQITWDSVYVKK